MFVHTLYLIVTGGCCLLMKFMVIISAQGIEIK